MRWNVVVKFYRLWPSFSSLENTLEIWSFVLYTGLHNKHIINITNYYCEGMYLTQTTKEKKSHRERNFHAPRTLAFLWKIERLSMHPGNTPFGKDVDLLALVVCAGWYNRKLIEHSRCSNPERGSIETLEVSPARFLVKDRTSLDASRKHCILQGRGLACTCCTCRLIQPLTYRTQQVQ